MTSLHPVLARLAGRPLALAPRALDALLAAIRPVEARPAAVMDLREAMPTASRGYSIADHGIAIVPVVGPLVSRGDWLSMILGAPSYGEIGDTVAAALADPTVRAVLLEVDSPGGEIGGLFDVVDRIAALRAESGKPLWAVASENALSAAFAIASVADRLYATRTAEVGSVGVVAIHVDESAADAMAGFKWTLIHAGEKKIDGNPHEPLSGSARSDIQADVDALHAELVGLVAQNRGMRPDAVAATEAAIYRGQRAINIGFADRLGTVDQALADLAESLAPSRPRPVEPRRAAVSPQLPRRPSAMTTDTATNAPADLPAAAPKTTESPAPPEADPLVPAAPAPVVQPTQPERPAPSGDTADRLRAEFADVAAIAAQAARLGVTVDAAEALRQGIKPDTLRRSVLDTLATRAEASAVVATAPAAAPGSLSGAGGDSPIVRRARERAAAARA